MVLEKIIQKNTPLTESTFYILIAVAEPLHGYGIMNRVKDLSGGRVQLGPGTLYGALSNLQQIGLIEAADDGSGSERRKAYRMTAAGRTVAEYEIDRLEEMARNGRDMLNIGGKNG